MSGKAKTTFKALTSGDKQVLLSKLMTDAEKAVRFRVCQRTIERWTARIKQDETIEAIGMRVNS